MLSAVISAHLAQKKRILNNPNWCSDPFRIQLPCPCQLELKLRLYSTQGKLLTSQPRSWNVPEGGRRRAALTHRGLYRHSYEFWENGMLHMSAKAIVTPVSEIRSRIVRPLIMGM